MSEQIKTIMNPKDSKPAFPHDNQELGDKHRVAQPGLTKREWFAGMVINALLHNTTDPRNEDDWARIAFRVADAMAERCE